MQKFCLVLFQIFISNSAIAQNYKYKVDINNIVDDKVKVLLQVPQQKAYTVFYNFPKTVPGTYAIQDYGKYIENFKAFDKESKPLAVKKQGNNTFIIADATQLASISYEVNDAMDIKVKDNPIFQPASTNIEVNKNIVINNGGFFGYFEGTESLPIEIEFTKPNDFYGATSLKTEKLERTYQKFKATSYHNLVDCPILFAKPDTTSFNVNNTKVTLACYDVQGKARAKQFYELLKNDMKAIAKFLPVLPVENYTFIIFVDNKVAAGENLSGQNGFFKTISTAWGLRKLAIGALEHGNSSLYYLADFGSSVKMPDVQLDKQLASAAIHEFMHILTPLNLHSQHIGNFNYLNPIMSKHLWMYEGVTEYFANLIKLQNGIYTPEKFFSEMKSKISAGDKFPENEMTYTEMSANVLEKKYHKQYQSVYTRGAVLAWMLDVEIIKITKGEKTLKDVILVLNKKYGKDKSFEEEQLFKDFASVIGNEIMPFFTKYIDGKTDWNINESLEVIGVNYFKNQKMRMPISPINTEQNDISFSMIDKYLDRDEMVVKKVGKNEWAGLQAGDKINKSDWLKIILDKGKMVEEGSTVNFKIKRDGAEKILPIKIKYAESNLENYLGFSFVRTPLQEKNWKVFINE